MTTDLARALLLLHLTSDIVYQRRELEASCGYPPEYGKDKELLAKIEEFLAAKGWTAGKLVKFLKEETQPPCPKCKEGSP